MSGAIRIDSEPFEVCPSRAGGKLMAGAALRTANFSDQSLIQRVRTAAFDAKIQLNAPEKDFMLCPTIPGSNIPDKTYILNYINQLAKIKGYKIDNHDPNYARVRDGIYESIQQVSDAQREKMKKGGAARWFS